MLTRRDFIKAMSAVGGILLTPLGRLRLWKEADQMQASEPAEGELYAGFLLLPEDALMPLFVQCAPAPILCHVDDEHDPEVMALRGETLWFDNIDELIGNLSFHIYVPTSLPANMAFFSGDIIRFAQSGEVFQAKIDFSPAGSRQAVVSLSARPVYPRPYPVWPIPSPLFDGDQVEPAEDEKMIPPEKVDFTPVPGLLLQTAEGHVLQWIRHNILHTLVVEHDRRRDAAVNIARSLVEISPNRSR